MIVYQNETCQSENRRLFERIIEWSKDIAFPYDHFFEVMQVCFPKCIVVFELVER